MSRECHNGGVELVNCSASDLTYIRIPELSIGNFTPIFRDSVTAREPFADRLAVARKLWEDRLGKGAQPDRVFAAALDFGPTYLSGIQKSITPPPHDRVLAIAKLTGADPGWLTYGEDSKAPAPEQPAVVNRPALKRQGRMAPRTDAELGKKPDDDAREA
jgi:hypothetical protein